ncbi:RB1-inducible coiled-coil protein 1-like [Convolutriloba macropyga]|uniref:RB1-inducible coiled-coil protein 1-like n=1 Tax=Convolutriloba macropyga TaxID=536237 RepID=UPI003F51FC03
MSGDLCVFLVDNGSTHEFSVEKYVGAQVEALQFGIFEELGIEPQNQVLIMENGIQLQPNRKLAQYSCGTGDANPIFLFSKQTIQNPDPPSASVHNHSYEAADIRTELEQSLKQTNATIDLVQSRTDLASRVVQLDQRLATETESLARDQHLQHQGWLASVANLEMYTENVLNLNDLLSAEISESRDQLGKCDQLLAQLPESFDCLKCLPVPPSVAENLTTLSGHNQSSSNCSNLSSPLFNSSPLEQQAFGTGEVVETAGFCASMSPKTMSLYEYLSKHERFYDLDELGSQMEYHLSHYTPHSLQTLSNDVTAVVDEIRTSQDMKRIRNFTVRIEDLVKSGKQLEKAMERQEILHRSFLSLKNQFQTVPDRSVLGDLCFTHVKQLQEMSELHMRIVQVNNYNKMAKDELSQNLHLRLQWIVKMQAKLVRCESQKAMRRENLKRIVARIQLLEQLIVAPQYAVEILSEVYRRRTSQPSFYNGAPK